MIVAVGSTNTTKLDPVRDIFSKHFKGVVVKGIAVDSGVDDQPMTDEEMYQGALTRARTALAKVNNAEYGVGIEGGLHKRSYGWFEHSIIVIINRTGTVGVGASGGLVLPETIMQLIHKGKTLEEAVDGLFNTQKIGQGIGMFGLMTKGVVTRSSGVAHGVAFALAPFLHPQLYK